MSELSKEQKRLCKKSYKACGKHAVAAVQRMIETPAPETIEDAESLRLYACAMAQAWQEECDRLGGINP